MLIVFSIQGECGLHVLPGITGHLRSAPRLSSKYLLIPAEYLSLGRKIIV